MFSGLMSRCTMPNYPAFPDGSVLAGFAWLPAVLQTEGNGLDQGIEQIA
jgi:hypothetical protein